MTDLSTTAGKLADLTARLTEAQAPVGDRAIAEAHEAGRLTARERIGALLDASSFVEVDALARHRVSEYGLDSTRPTTDGVVAGYGTVAGRKVCVYAQDASIFDGRLGEVYGEKILKIYRLAIKTGVPVIAFIEGAGARAAEGTAALSFYARILAEATQASGVIPHLAVLTGEVTGPHALLAGAADLTLMVAGQAHLRLTATANTASADAASADSGEEPLGAEAHAEHSCTAHLVAESDAQAIEALRELLGYLPSNNRAEAPRPVEARITGSIAENISATDTQLNALIPDDPQAPYDMREVITRVVDGQQFLETQSRYATNILTGFARIEGRAVGIVANQPTQDSGRVDSRAATKAARFIRTCDAFNIPVISFVDVPGFVPGTSEELGGAVRSVSKLAYAYAEASVGTLTVITRHAIGAASVVMGAKDLGADLVFAWPTAQIAAMHAETAVPEIHAAELAKAQRKGKDVEALREKFAAEYNERHLSPYQAAERGMVDAVIPPEHTRGQLVEGLRLLDRKVTYPPAKKHGNIAL
ncbi:MULTISPECIES: acyl-CoA carboxylase subunit beta [unclassified Corynebacterium]|uniref:acyl-CoA carboxylase subunit beta n=1 Tax=unclassified Corynebacterium TaxID=2624378 RepID=UPI0029CA0F4E|nr:MULTISPECIES: acyl-CoA carboxylase subunit beta [unclassified Corynebacterium]WPF66620.1 acyl-CoA carboxylase subunit beta [Corynebacterium sp. 22KM0430]WPF69108.1 acyl-CoA carboxylase subunit beta [Corynebacterium sp. 21KM1197]